MAEMVILVDNDDNPVGEAEKMEAHRLALLHRAVSVFVLNNENKMLLQKRASNKYHSPELWTNTACTHPYPGESNIDAVNRRLMQEMGLKASNIREIFHFIYREQLDGELTEHELDHVFIGYSNQPPVPVHGEVSDYAYVDVNTVLENIATSPHVFTVWFKKIASRVAEHLKQDGVI